jgi:hypothetical protein
MPKKIKVVDVNAETPVEQVPNVTVEAVTPKRLLLPLRFHLLQSPNL